MQIIQDYRNLHRIPELDRCLPKTLAYIRSSLEPYRCKIFSPAPGAICAYFPFGKQRTIAFRADMDALPIQEQTDLPWQSQHPGMMHACGHDGHTAILLELARKLQNAKHMPCNILLIFQPAEETTGGAQAICKTNIFEKYAVCYIFALHLWPGLEKGQLFSKPGTLMSYSTAVTASFSGASGHIADPAPSCDVLGALCSFYGSLGQINVTDPYLLKFGKIAGGTAENILCQSAKLSGSLRTLDPDTTRRVSSVLTTVCHQAAKEYGCNGELSLKPGYPAVQNSPDLWKKVQKICPVKQIDRAFWTTEDFSYYQKRVPGMYFLLGIGDTPPLHSPNLTFDDSVLSIGADYFWKLCKTM